MNETAKHAERIHEVRRLFEHHGFGNAELLEGWDGIDLKQLTDLLTEEEYQTLLDSLEEQAEPSSG